MVLFYRSYGMKGLRLSAWRLPNQWKSLHKILQNVGWLALDRLLGLVTGLLVGAWVARYLGPQQLGVWAYAAAFVSLFAAVAGLGLNNIVVRELVRDETRKHEFLGTALALRFGGSFVALLTSIWLIDLVRPTDPLLRNLVVILAAGVVIQSFDVLALWFQALVESKYVVWSRRFASLILAVVQVALILTNAPLIAFVWAVFLETCVASLGFIYFYLRTNSSLRWWKFDVRLALDLLRDSWPLIISGVAVSIYMRIDKLMLGEMVGDEAVGLYEAAVRISELWYFIPVAIASTVFPLIVKSHQQKDESTYRRRLQSSFDVMLGITYLIVVIVMVTAKPLVLVLFGESYRESATILQIHIWAMVFVTVGLCYSQWLITEGIVQFSIWSTVLGALVNVLMNYWLIPIYGGTGAAWATVVAYAIAAYIAYLFWPQLRSTGWQLTLAILLPFRIRKAVAQVSNILTDQ